jgi:3-hydroxyacyl-[acyl-carrier-protein] dehydratase
MSGLHRAAPFVARWDLGPLREGRLEGRLALDDLEVFAGHYPGEPILPGSYLVDALFQAAAAALGGSWRLSEIVSCRYHTAVLPGDVVQAAISLSDDERGKVVDATASAKAQACEIKLRLSPAGTAEPRVEASPEVRPGLTWEQVRREGKPLDQAFIRRALPHRFPALLADGAAIGCLDTPKPVLVGRKAVTVNESCYSAGELTDWGYPASLLTESFCQACGLLRAGSAPAGTSRDPTKVPVLARLAKVRFLGQVMPGEVAEHRVRLAARMPDGAMFSGETVVGGRMVLQVERVLAATRDRPSAGER